MDGLKAFTQVLPLLLAKLEIVRQVLETHGITGGEIGLVSWPNEVDFIYVWTWSRSRYILKVEFNFNQKNTSDDGCWIEMYLSPTQNEEVGGDGIWVDSNDDGWAVGNHREDYNPPLEADPIDQLWSNLTRLGIDYENPRVGETTGREAMSMIATFFAKLPEDPPKTAG